MERNDVRMARVECVRVVFVVETGEAQAPSTPHLSIGYPAPGEPRMGRLDRGLGRMSF